MRNLIKRDWRALSGVVLLSAAMASMGWSEDDQAMTKRSHASWQEKNAVSSLQSVAFEPETKASVVAQTAGSDGEIRIEAVLTPAELVHSEYCDGRCRPEGQIMQMALNDPINRLPLDGGEAAVSASQQKGRLARVQFYMHERYSLPWHKGQLQTMCQWASQSPVDGWELARNRQLTAMGGVSNPFVDMPEQLVLRCKGLNA